MQSVEYFWNKLVRKVKGKAIRNSKLANSSKVEAGTLFLNSSMDRYSFCGYDCKIINCEIGAFCSIADGVIIGGAQHPINWASTSPVFYKGRDSVKKKFSEFERDFNPRTNIGNDVWIGERALIQGGITIGNGSVIGMGSIVTKNIPAYEIWAGNPARFIRKRFSEEIALQFQNIEWWNVEDEKIAIAAQFVQNPNKFVKTIKGGK